MSSFRRFKHYYQEKMLSSKQEKDNGMCHMRISFKVDNNIHTKFHMIFNNIKLYVYQISDFVSKWINAPYVL